MPEPELKAYIFAFTALFVLLIDKARLADPSFDEFAKKQFDTLLGLLLKERGEPGTIEHHARSLFSGILKTTWGDMNIDPALRTELAQFDTAKPSAKPTLRRRFLDWLQRG